MIRTRVAFIGAGGIAGRHTGNLLGFEDVKIVAFADTVLERAQSAATRCEAQAYADYREMLDREKPDAVYICVPPFAHGPLELAAIERDIPFFVEKPIAINDEIAEEIARRVAERRLVTAAGYHWRYLDTTEEAQELLAKTPARLALGYWIDGTPPPAWWVRQELSGGQMLEQTTHIFDLTRVLVGDVSSVYTTASRMQRAGYPDSDIDDVTVANLRFASGAVGAMSSTCLLKWPHRIGLHLFCDGMAIEMSEFELMVDVGRGRPVRQAAGDPFIREDRDFVDAVQGKPNRIRAPYSEAIKTHRLLWAATQSARQGQAIELANR